MTTHTPLTRPPHARIDHDAIHRAALKSARRCARDTQLRRGRSGRAKPKSRGQGSTTVTTAR